MKTTAMLVLALGLGFAVAAAAGEWPADLNAVKFREAPKHPPVVLVEGGAGAASIAAMGGVGKEARELQRYIQAATGVELPIVKTIKPPAIVLGDCPEAAAQGLVGQNMPPEGFAIKTAENLVFIVGSPTGPGVRWGVYEFLERFVGMRWYFDTELGLDIPKSDKLVVAPVWLEDAPAFRMREIWPPVGGVKDARGEWLAGHEVFNRSANTWPIRIQVHAPSWNKHPELMRDRPEVFQMQKDGKRQFEMICYGNPKTLETYLEGIQAFLDKKQPAYAPISKEKAITVSPADLEIACYCPDCRKLWDDNAGGLGTASRVMATFVDKLAREVKQRWPNEGFTVIFLPYLNYTAAPDGFKFPDNVEVQICGMPGMACLKEPAIRDAERATIEKWQAISGRKVQTWLYSCWPADKTKAAYQYPHATKAFYQENRDRIVGSFINGMENHWPRQHISLYCWQKLLWNPDYDVDAAMDAFCTRMFGPAAGTMRALLALQTDGWEKSSWPDGRLSGKGIYEASFPPATVEKMRKLFDQAKAEAKGDPLVTTRLNYYFDGGLKNFFAEADMMSGKGFKPLLLQKVGEGPTLDGKLDDPQWARAQENPFVVATGPDQGKPARYATTVRGLWTPDGVYFGFRMSEPAPDKLFTVNGGHDNGQAWWDDNIEMFLDVTGKSTGDHHQIIVTAAQAVYDGYNGSTTWEAQDMKTGVFVGPDFWSLEVFLPFSAFPEATKPGPGGANCFWTGNFTRHRVADGRDSKTREYQRMNTTGAASSANMSDFSEIRFVE